MADSNITKNALAASLKNLMHQKAFEKISVSDICEACGMNRKSFYYHFKDKYDLVNWIFYVDFLGKMKFDSYETGWDAMLDACRYFYEDRKFYANALRIEGQNSFHEYIIETIRPILTFYLQNVYDEEDTQNFFVTFFGDAFLASVLRWITQQPDMTPEQFMDYYKEIGIGLVKIIIRDEHK